MGAVWSEKAQFDAWLEERHGRTVGVEYDFEDLADVWIWVDKIKAMIPELEQGTFVAVKEAVKKVVPHEYELIKELREILNDRNLIKYL